MSQFSSISHFKFRPSLICAWLLAWRSNLRRREPQEARQEKKSKKDKGVKQGDYYVRRLGWAT